MLASLLGMDSSTDAKVALDRAVRVFLGGHVAPTTVETLQKQLENPQVLQAKLDDPQNKWHLGVVAGLVLGAPGISEKVMKPLKVEIIFEVWDDFRVPNGPLVIDLAKSPLVLVSSIGNTPV